MFQKKNYFAKKILKMFRSFVFLFFFGLISELGRKKCVFRLPPFHFHIFFFDIFVFNFFVCFPSGKCIDKQSNYLQSIKLMLNCILLIICNEQKKGEHKKMKINATTHSVRLNDFPSIFIFASFLLFLVNIFVLNFAYSN